MTYPNAVLEKLKEDRKNFADGTQEAFMLDVMIAQLGQAIVNEGEGLTVTTTAGSYDTKPTPITVEFRK